MDNWTDVNCGLPALGDRSVLVHFDNGSIETVHVEDYFMQITAGVIELTGAQLYSYMYLNSGITHWMELPCAPGFKKGVK